jgi:hypothetical protein
MRARVAMAMAPTPALLGDGKLRGDFTGIMVLASLLVRLSAFQTSLKFTTDLKYIFKKM